MWQGPQEVYQTRMTAWQQEQPSPYLRQQLLSGSKAAEASSNRGAGAGAEQGQQPCLCRRLHQLQWPQRRHQSLLLLVQELEQRQGRILLSGGRSCTETDRFSRGSCGLVRTGSWWPNPPILEQGSSCSGGSGSRRCCSLGQPPPVGQEQQQACLCLLRALRQSRQPPVQGQPFQKLLQKRQNHQILPLQELRLLIPRSRSRVAWPSGPRSGVGQ